MVECVPLTSFAFQQPHRDKYTTKQWLGQYLTIGGIHFKWVQMKLPCHSGIGMKMPPSSQNDISSLISTFRSNPPKRPTCATLCGAKMIPLEERLQMYTRHFMITKLVIAFL